MPLQLGECQVDLHYEVVRLKSATDDERLN